MIAGDLSILRGVVAHDQRCSRPEFEEWSDAYSSPDDRLVFFRKPKLHPQLIDNGLVSNGSIKRLLEGMTSALGECKYMVQFWAPELMDDHLYLTTAHQPFAVGLLCNGLCWYRQRCMAQVYRVDDGTREEDLGVVGRVYRNRQPESTPDLRLYSSNEFAFCDVAARYGLRSLLAVPLLDARREKCYGVIEVYYGDVGDVVTHSLEEGLKAAKLRTTHSNLGCFRNQVVNIEVTNMLESAIRVMPQLQMAQVWIPCNECSKLSCMQRAVFVSAADGKVNSLKGIDKDMCNYLKACDLHNLPVGKHTNMIAAVMSSSNKSCVCRNVCDFSIFENPLVHYAQKARLSFYFAICLQSMEDSKDVYVVEFFLQFNSREDEFAGFFLSLLLRIMEMELRSFDFAYRGQQGEEFSVEVHKGNRISNALGNEFIKFKHQDLEELDMLMSVKGSKGLYLLSDFTKYLNKVNLHCLQPLEKSKCGWVFWSQAKLELFEEVDSNSSFLPNSIHEKIKLLMREMTSTSDTYSLAQFWAPTLDGDRCHLETSRQPFALGCLYQGLAYFRKQCMEHRYFVDEGAKEEELGPPGRAFVNGHPEFTPDLRLYSPTEFPLRNHAAHCGFRKYLALPIFDMNQNKCVGVLELIEFSSSAIEVIEMALGAANLSSTRSNFKPSLQGSLLVGYNVECWQLAMTEIQGACKLFKEIPQLSMVEVWISHNRCSIGSNALSCMERVWASNNIPELDLPMCQIQHVEAGKGIAGMAIASENKACFCPHSSEFSIADQPLAHFAWRARLNGCFAICLQSLHTGDLLYVLQFYLNPGRGEYESLRSFLCWLLPIMKQKLKSFKVASGQQLGERLVVEVMASSEVNEPVSSEIGLLDKFPFVFKLVEYEGQKHSKDKQVQLASKEFVTSIGEAEHIIPPASDFTSEDLESHSVQKRKDAANALGIGVSTPKRTCTRESARDSQQNMNVPLRDPKSSQDVIFIYAKHDNKMIKFEWSNSAGMEKLVNEVATRLKLEEESLEMEYLDEINEKMLITCDDDFEVCSAAASKLCIQVYVRSIDLI